MHIFSYGAGSWKKVRDFPLGYHESQYYISVAVKGDRITCCSYSFHEIQVYSLTGKRLENYSTRNQMVTSQLGCPFICTSDSDGCVLLADSASHRLQVMSERGEFKSLQLQPQMTSPCSAALFYDDMYVASEGKVIRKYTKC